MSEQDTWYFKAQGDPHNQGLIISETTGENMAVAYSAKNAPLIAAAPELLTSLETAIREIESTHEANATREPEWMDGIRAVVAKAKGEQ